MRQDLMWFTQLFGGGAGGGIDLGVVLAFIAFAVLYFLVPVVGYGAERPAGMLAALYLLAASVGLAVVQTIVNWMPILSQSGSRPTGGDEWTGPVMFAVALIKVGLFFAAMLAFITGLRSLRRDRSGQDRNPPYGIGR